jgi:hypothetical protein
MHRRSAYSRETQQVNGFHADLQTMIQLKALSALML